MKAIDVKTLSQLAEWLYNRKLIMRALRPCEDRRNVIEFRNYLGETRFVGFGVCWEQAVLQAMLIAERSK